MFAWAFVTLVIGAAGANTVLAALALAALFDVDQIYIGLMCLAGLGLVRVAFGVSGWLGKTTRRSR